MAGSLTLFQVLSLALAAASVAVVAARLSTAIKTMKADHERRKKLATIEHVREVRPRWEASRAWLEGRFQGERLTQDGVQEVDKDPKARENIRSLLALLEHLAVGVNTGVFDRDLLYRMSASTTIRIYDQLRPYIKRRQQENPYAYVEFEDMVTLFQEYKRTKPDPRGGIRLS